MKKDYQILLYYGIEECESECSTFHSFRAVDPQQPHDDDAIAADLAEQLDCNTDDDNFQCRNMYIDLPESLTRRIQQDAISAFIATGAQHICKTQAMLANEIHRIVQRRCHLEDIEGKLYDSSTEYTEAENAKIALLTPNDLENIAALFESGLSKNEAYYDAFWMSAEDAIRQYLSRMI